MSKEKSRPLIQIDDEIREMNEEEYSVHLNSQKESQELDLAKFNARKSALAKLAALGLTEEEIASL